jgi:small subunit ribosomal protein S17
MTDTTPDTNANATSDTAAKRELLGKKIGFVTSDKRDKTRTVKVDYQIKHPKYGKYLKRSQTFQVHDEKNEAKDGDRVEIGRCRPLSKTKSWRLIRVVEAAMVD